MAATTWASAGAAGGSAGLSRWAAWALALTATLTMAVSYVDRQALAVLAPTVTRELEISEGAYGWLMSAFSISYLVASPLAGRLIDRIGARRGLPGAVLLWSLVAAAHALVPSFAALFALRIALGLAEAPSFPGAAQTVQRALPPADRARGFGVLFTGSSLGAMLAPLLATAMQKRWGFRVAFLGTAGIGMIWLPVWLLVAFHPAARRALDRSRGGPAAQPGDEAGEARPAAAPAEGAPRAAPSWRELLTDVAVLRAVAVVFSFAPMMAFLINWGSKYLVRDHGLTQEEVWPYLLFPPLSYDVGAIAFGHFASLRAGRLRDGSPPRALFAAAAVLCALTVAISLARGPVEAMAVASLCMLGGGGLAALLTADMLSRVHPGAVSAAGGLTAAAQSMGLFLTSPLIGGALQRGASYGAVAAALGAWVIPGCALWLLWRPPPPYEEEGTRGP
jgi:ACS family hexuronate transporter-like MFS transporter